MVLIVCPLGRKKKKREARRDGFCFVSLNVCVIVCTFAPPSSKTEAAAFCFLLKNTKPNTRKEKKKKSVMMKMVNFFFFLCGFVWEWELVKKRKGEDGRMFVWHVRAETLGKGRGRKKRGLSLFAALRSGSRSSSEWRTRCVQRPQSWKFHQHLWKFPSDTEQRGMRLRDQKKERREEKVRTCNFGEKVAASRVVVEEVSDVVDLAVDENPAVVIRGVFADLFERVLLGHCCCLSLCLSLCFALRKRKKKDDKKKKK